MSGGVTLFDLFLQRRRDRVFNNLEIKLTRIAEKVGVSVATETRRKASMINLHCGYSTI